MRCSLTSAKYRGMITTLVLLATLFLIQAGIGIGLVGSKRGTKPSGKEVCLYSLSMIVRLKFVVQKGAKLPIPRNN